MQDEFDLSSGNPSEDMLEYLQMFVDETNEQLDALVDALLILEIEPQNQAQLNESFRLIHSIKGAAAMMGLDSITLLTHHLENHFERLRSGIQLLDRPMIELILRCVDFLREATSKLREGKSLVSEPDLLEALARHEGSDFVMEDHSIEESPKTIPPTKPTIPALVVAETLREPDASSTKPKSNCCKRIIIYFDPNLELPELKAHLILSRLSEQSRLLRSSPSKDQLETIVDIRTLQVWVETHQEDHDLRSMADVVGVEFIEIDEVSTDSLADEEEEDVCTWDESSITETHEAPPERAQADYPVVNPEVVAAEPTPVANLEDQLPKIPVTIDVPKATQSNSESQSKVGETMRVDIQRLDKLMNLAGELVVNRARFVQLAGQMQETFKKTGLIGQLRDLFENFKQALSSSEPTQPIADIQQSSNVEGLVVLREQVDALETQLQVLERGRRSFLQLTEAIDQFSRVSDGIQRGVLDTRMVPVAPLFNRFKRTVRDIAIELGKQVHLEIRGENTELDKRMIDELGDPLIHLVRNAIDHGIESESVRRSRGKPEIGTLSLEASHSGNHVLIHIRDDGGGLNIEKIKKRAIERGLISSSEAEAMNDHQISQFIWSPGFSTAETVSDISGRGVGMDIVKTRIRELNGTIEVNSVHGKGSTFIIRLPLTLAIIRSLVFTLRHGVFAAPIENVREIVSIRSNEVISIHGRNSIEVRGEFVPLIDIDDIFDWNGEYPGTTQDENEQSKPTELSVLILSTLNRTMGLLVSGLKGSQDLVVKSLDENFTHIRGLAGASILGDGTVCLLLDISSSIDLAHERLRNLKHNALRKQPASR